MQELTAEVIVDARARSALLRLKARVARRPGRWRRRMARTTGRAVLPVASVQRGLAIAA